MNLSFHKVEGVGVVRVNATRIDAAVAIQFKDRFSDVVGCLDNAAAKPAGPLCEKMVLLDMSEVEFLDSSGLGAVVAARKLLGKQRQLALAGLQPAVEKVLRLTHMDRVFPIYRNADAFLADVSSGQGA